MNINLIKKIKIIGFLLLPLFIISCGGGGESKSSSQSTNSVVPSNQVELKPRTSIKIDRTVKVLFLHSNASDAGTLTREQLEDSFQKVQNILDFNKITTKYIVTYQYYDNKNNYDSKALYDLTVSTPIVTEYPETKVLAQSSWIQESANKTIVNNHDIIINRINFDKTKTPGGNKIWGAAQSTIEHTEFLKTISGLTKNIAYLNAPIDINDSSHNYEHNIHLDSNLRLNNYDRVLAHEFIHGLGYHGHDNGVKFDSKEEFSLNTIKNIKFFETQGDVYEYGDPFSIMGGADFSLMISPSVFEVLGGNLDSVSVFKDSEITLNKNQVLKVFLKREKNINNSPDDDLFYLTVSRIENESYSKSLNGELLSLDGSKNISLLTNLNGLLIRLVKVNVALGLESIPNSIVLDANPPIDDYIYTLQTGSNITIGNIVKIEHLQRDENNSKIKIDYL